MKIIKVTALVFFTVIILMSSWILYEKYRDPISVLDQSSGKVQLAEDISINLEGLPNGRDYRHVFLTTEHLGTVEAMIGQPKNCTKKLPVLLIMGGWETRAKYLKLIPNSDAYIIVMYKYPYSSQNWKTGNSLIEVFNIQDAIYSVPGQILTLSEWLSNQRMVDQDRISLLGFSLGAIFAPAVYHLDHHRDQRLRQGVIAFGGADLYDMFYTNFKNVPSSYRPLVSYVAATMISAIEPAYHLPKMQNEFLLINGSKDKMLTPHSINMLHKLTPEPKTVVSLDEGHIQPKKSDLITELVAISTQWLREKGLLDPI